MKRRTFLKRGSLFGMPLFGIGVAGAQATAQGGDPSGLSAVEAAAGIEPVDYRRPPGDVMRYGATGDGKTDDSAAIQRAISASSRVYFPPGRYMVRKRIELRTGSSLVGDGAATLFTDGVNSILSAIGIIGPPQPVRRSIRRGDAGLAAAVGSAGSYAAAGGVWLQSDDLPLGHASHRSGELGVIARVDGDEIETGVGILGDYRLEARAMAAPVQFVRLISVSGLAFRNTNYAENPARPTSPLVYLEFVAGLRLANCDLRENNSAAISVFNCLNAVIAGNTIGDLTDAGHGLLGYGVQVGFASQNVSISGNSFSRCRHAVTTGTGTRASRTPNYGVSRGLVIVGNSVSQCTNAGLDTHEDSDGVTISGNAIIGCSPAGIQVRSYRSSITGNTITSCSGMGIRVARSARDTVISGNVIRGVRRREVDGDGIAVDGPAVTVAANRISECDRHGIAVQRNALSDVNINGNTCKNNGIAVAGDGINIDRGGPLSRLLIIGNTCTDDQVTATQRHHIAIEPGTVLSKDDSLIANNVLSRASSHGYSNRGSGSPKIVSNAGIPSQGSRTPRERELSAENGPLLVVGDRAHVAEIADGVPGQTIRVLATGQARIVHGPRLRLGELRDFAMQPGDIVTLTMFEDQVWRETARSRTGA